MIYKTVDLYVFLFINYESLFWVSLALTTGGSILIVMIINNFHKKYAIGSFIYNNSVYILYLWFILYILAMALGFSRDRIIIISLLNFPIYSIIFILTPLCFLNVYLNKYSKEKIHLKPLEHYPTLYSLLQTHSNYARDIDLIGPKHIPIKEYLVLNSDQYLKEIKDSIQQKHFNQTKVLLKYIQHYEKEPTFKEILTLLSEELKNYPNEEILSLIIYKNFTLDDFYADWGYKIFNNTDTIELRDILGNHLVKTHPTEISEIVQNAYTKDQFDIITLDGAGLITGTLINLNHTKPLQPLINNIENLSKNSKFKLIETIIESNDPQMIDQLYKTICAKAIISTQSLFWLHIHLSDYAIEKYLKEHPDIDTFIDIFSGNNNPQLSHIKMFDHISHCPDFAHSTRTKAKEFLEAHKQD
jgi:hypothetical protein